MDPTECLRRFLQHQKDGERAEANEAWLDLRDWLARGGFEPKWGALCTIVTNGEPVETTLPTREEFSSFVWRNRRA